MHAHPRIICAGSRLGFSLVEMLAVIAVIGIMAVIAVPIIGRLSDTAHQTAAKRNAQNFASVSTSLAGVGVEHVVPESLGGTEATCRLIRNGLVVPEGPFKGMYFGLPGIEVDNISPAAIYLDIRYNDYIARHLIYVIDGKP